jgi:hypothetical protein
MLLGRVQQRLRSQNWTGLAMEFAIVVVGVFLGLQVQEWAQEQDRRKLEISYTERLHDEVMGLQATRAQLIELRLQTSNSLNSLTPVLFSTIDRPITIQECSSVAEAYFVTNPTDDLASLIALQSSGRLSMLRNEQLSAALRSFLLTRARARDSQKGIAAAIKMLSSEYPHLIQIVSPTPAEGNASYRCDVDGMRASKAFLNDFDITRSNLAFHIRDNANVSGNLISLHNVLDEILSIEHE